ncbi:hypothetical protein BH10CYA1_BH10CYA1_11910 [soil metagenome]
MLEILKKILGRTLGGKTAVPTNSSIKRDALRASKLRDSQSLPDVDGPFNLLWSIEHDLEFEDILLFKFTTDGGILLNRELATFEDSLRAQELVSLLRTKYGTQLEEICLAPGVGIYVGGCNTSGFESFIKHVCQQGYERVDGDMEFSKRDGATREIFVPETVFRLVKG